MSEQVEKRYPANPIVPVIHLQPGKEGQSQAVIMAEMVADAGVGGVFLIDHNEYTLEEPEVLAEAVAEVMRQVSPELWVGVNCLGKSALGSLEIFSQIGVDGVWSDNAMRWSKGMRVLENLDWIEDRGNDLKEAKAGNTTHFGGISMKGWGYVKDREEASRLVAHTQQYVDVVTTSGVGTGSPIECERLQALRDVVQKGRKLAVASGVNPINLGWHLDSADYVLVGSSIEKEHSLSGIFDQKKLADLMSAFLDWEIEHPLFRSNL